MPRPYLKAATGQQPNIENLKHGPPDKPKMAW